MADEITTTPRQRRPRREGILSAKSKTYKACMVGMFMLGILVLAIESGDNKASK